MFALLLTPVPSSTGSPRFSRRWDVLGPFPVGKTEYDGDPVESCGGITALHATKRGCPSELVVGGFAKWSTVSEGQGGVQLHWADVPWQALHQASGSVEAVEFQAWVVGMLAVPEAGLHTVKCEHLHTLQVAGTTLTGNIYGDSALPYAALHLDSGEHTVLSRIRGKATARFRCTARRAARALQVQSASVPPDVSEGQLPLGGLHSVSVLNPTGEWLSEIVVAVAGRASGAPLLAANLDESSHGVQLAPGQLISLPVRLTLPHDTVLDIDAEGCVRFRLRVEAWPVGGGDAIMGQSGTVALRCRTRAQSFVFGFVDHDGSASHAAVIRPRGECVPWPHAKSGARCPVLLSLSGVGATASSQADAHKYMAPGDSSRAWTFGLQKAWVLSPQRDGAHNWEGQGHLCAFAALHALADATRDGAHAADPKRLVLSGHSRGGHGAWVILTNHPDVTLAAVPAAGWFNRQYCVFRGVGVRTLTSAPAWSASHAVWRSPASQTATPTRSSCTTSRIATWMRLHEGCSKALCSSGIPALPAETHGVCLCWPVWALPT